MHDGMLCNVGDHKVVTQKSVVGELILGRLHILHIRSLSYVRLIRFWCNDRQRSQMPHYMGCDTTGLSRVDTHYPY